MRVRFSVIQGPEAGRSITLDSRSSLVVGRCPDAVLSLAKDEQIDFYHAVIDFVPPRVVVRDLGGPGGTQVNGRMAPLEGAELAHGDLIRVGRSVMRFDRMAEVVSVTASTELLDEAGGGAPPATERMIAVRCRGCGERTEHRVPASETSGAACFCDDCRRELQGKPPALPGYRLVRELGRGGVGVVYLAEHEQHGPRVLKVLLPETAVREQNRKMFVREARKQAGLLHPNVVELHDFVEPAPGVFVAVLEYVPGESCDRLLERHPGGLPPALAVAVVSEALAGLSFLHGRGLVHRDIKEANLLVAFGEGGELRAVKIADFGLAKSYDESGASALTRPGQIGGTPPYMSPEQIRQFRRVQPPADIYAMGATLYRLLTGQFAHEFPPDRHPFHVILTEAPVPLRQRRPELPEELARVVETAMAREAAQRFASAEAMRAALLAALPGAGAS